MVYHGRFPKNWWLKATETYHFTVWEARSVKSRCWQGCTFSGASREEDFLLFPLLWAFFVIASLQSLSLSSHSLFLCIFVLPSLRMISIWFRAHRSNLGWSHLKIFYLIISAKILPQIRSLSQVWELGLEYVFWRPPTTYGHICKICFKYTWLRLMFLFMSVFSLSHSSLC